MEIKNTAEITFWESVFLKSLEVNGHNVGCHIQADSAVEQRRLRVTGLLAEQEELWDDFDEG